MVPKHFGNGVQLVHLDQANTFHLYKLCRLYALVSSTLAYVQPSPPLRKKITGRGADFPIFSWVGGTAVHKLSSTSIFAVMIRSSYRSRNVLLVKDLTESGTMSVNKSQIVPTLFFLGEVTLTSFFLKMYLYKPFLGLHWLFPVQPWRRANPSRWSSQPSDCQSHTEMTSGFHGIWQQCCEGTSFPRMKKKYFSHNLKHVHRLKSGIFISCAFWYLILFYINFMCANSYPETTFWILTALN